MNTEARYFVNRTVKIYSHSIVKDDKVWFYFKDKSRYLQEHCFYLESNLYNIGDQFTFCVDGELGKVDEFWVMGVNLVTRQDIENTPKWQYFLVNSAGVHVYMYEDQIAEFNIEE